MKLVIMAAGMGSRYGGLKQIDGFGPNGETIMEYSVFDAARSGFEEVVFIIREDMVEGFYDKFDHRFGDKIKVSHVIQHAEVTWDGGKISRTKPWGTGHAILSAKDAVDTPFIVINADDFYGAKAFEQSAEYIKGTSSPNEYALVTYQLGNTLSPSGHVSRGVSQADENNYLTSIVEKKKIVKDGEQVYNIADDGKEMLRENTLVSMNFWILMPSVFGHLENDFQTFLAQHHSSVKEEFLLPTVLNDLMHQEKINIKVIESQDSWFGVTYSEDKATVIDNLKKLSESGIYPASLWARRIE